MGSDKKKESSVVKPGVVSTTIVSTLKQRLPKEQEKPKTSQDQIAESVCKMEIKAASAKADEKIDASPLREDKYPFKVPAHTGKESKRYWEWAKFKTSIKIKLINGDIYEGYLKWYDQFAVKLITQTDEIVIPKHSILCIFDVPRPKPEIVEKTPDGE